MAWTDGNTARDHLAGLGIDLLSPAKAHPFGAHVAKARANQRQIVEPAIALVFDITLRRQDVQPVLNRVLAAEAVAVF